MASPTTSVAPDVPPGLRDAILRDGTAVHLAAMEPDAAAALVRFHSALSGETTYLRFFSVHPELSRSEVEHFTRVDHQDREAILAVVGSEIIGVARFDRLVGTDDAEVAFVVADAWQGRGLGSAFLPALARRAREVGISRFVAQTLPQNRRMLSVFHHCGLPYTQRFQDGVMELCIELGSA